VLERLPGRKRREEKICKNKRLKKVYNFWVSMEFIASATQKWTNHTPKLDPDFTTAYKNNMIVKKNTQIYSFIVQSQL
jgi:hypothetical protein